MAPVAVVLTWSLASALISAAAVVLVIAGKALIWRFEPVGQEVMKPAAREKTLRTPRGVSKAEGTAADLDAVRMKV